MDLIVFNDPANRPLQTNLCDLMLPAMFLASMAYSVLQFRRGRRIAALRAARPPVPIERFTVGLVFTSASAIYPLHASRRGQTVSSPQIPAVAASAGDSR